MKLGIVVYSNDPETVFNAFRLGVFSLGKGDSVRVFLLAKGVESEALDDNQFKVSEQMQSFVDANGEMFACGTCLKIRKSTGRGRIWVRARAEIEQTDKSGKEAIIIHELARSTSRRRPLVLSLSDSSISWRVSLSKALAGSRRCGVLAFLPVPRTVR